MTAKNLVVSSLLFFTLGVAVDRSVAADMVIHSQATFTAGDQAFPAGSYRIESHVSKRVMIRNLETGKGVILPILAQIDDRDEQPRALFTVNGSQNTLSEIYLPGMGGVQLSTVAKVQNTAKWEPVGK